MRYVWTLHHEPHRHYKLSVDGKKPVWNANGKRIKSVTQVLSESGLASWAAGQAAAACERVMVDWFRAGPAIATSMLSVGQLAALQPEWPDNVRDAKGESGTALHHYMGARLSGGAGASNRREFIAGFVQAPYGLRVGVDDFLRERQPFTHSDRQGPCVERIVGDPKRAIAGTYDALVWMPDAQGELRLHRIDLKQSNYVKDDMMAQLAAYERCDRAHRADFLTVLHVSNGGTYDLYSIAVGSREHRAAMALFDARLTIARSPKLLIKESRPT
jgi:hypothetical protein